jgi:DNA invertase Pin-like site-specific DNA recombinase
MSTAVIYLRCAARRDGGKAIEWQRESCHRYAATRGIAITDEYVDVGSTRDARDRLLHDVAASPPTIVLIAAPDRFARHAADLQEGVAVFSNAGVDLVCADGVVLLSTAQARAQS